MSLSFNNIKVLLKEDEDNGTFKYKDYEKVMQLIDSIFSKYPVLYELCSFGDSTLDEIFIIIENFFMRKSLEDSIDRNYLVSFTKDFYRPTSNLVSFIVLIYLGVSFLQAYFIYFKEKLDCGEFSKEYKNIKEFSSLGAFSIDEDVIDDFYVSKTGLDSCPVLSKVEVDEFNIVRKIRRR